MRRRRFPLWTLLAVALVAALVVGSGVLSSSPPTLAQRAYAIESVLRCPSCEDLSVADSTAQTAVAVRTTVRQLLAQGRTDQQVESYLVARYGSTIVLDPPAHGWSLLVWLLPLVGGGAAVAALGTFLFRRRSGPLPDADVPRPAYRPGRGQLEERRDFLVRALADADAEHLAGDLGDEDYLTLRQRDLRLLRRVEAELGGVGAELAGAPPPARAGVPAAALSAGATEVAGVDRPAVAGEPDSVPKAPDFGGSDLGGPDLGGSDLGVDPAPAARAAAPTAGRTTRSRRSRWLLRGAAASFAAALIVAVSLFASNRLPGQTATGSVSATQSQLLAQTLDEAATLENQGQLGRAAQLYQSVLGGHPGNEVALAQLGWLEYQTGRSGNSASLMDDGQAKLGRAVRLDPGDYAARLYLGTVLLQRDANPGGAVGQFQRFLADDPPTALVQQAAPELRLAYQQAGVPVPSQLAG
ncbi:MAG TPA: cytochrome c-type biogenesis protein CcmH [Acidimicrobiales bacterium]|nr:cytochrome c-type biogenesis protein CcmH [Acidimicrobiales bacterium]